MNVASLDLCKELYELSGWDGAAFIYDTSYADNWLRYIHDFPIESRERRHINAVPAYDLGYLLRKLPKYASPIGRKSKQKLKLDWAIGQQWEIGYAFLTWSYAPTPEDAAAKLAIELFKQGLLQP